MADDYTASWKEVLRRLETTMTKATFNTWLKGSHFMRLEEDRFVVGVRNEFAKDWLENRLGEHIGRELVSVIGEGYRVVFEVWVDLAVARQKSLLLDDVSRETAVGVDTYPDFQFSGFEFPKANYVQVPHSLIDAVLPYVRPTVSILVLATLRQTVGVIVAGNGNRKEEWVTTYPQACLATGMGRTSIYTAVWEARAMGLIVFREVVDPIEVRDLVREEKLRVGRNQPVITLRPRWLRDGIDYPQTERPKR